MYKYRKDCYLNSAPKLGDERKGVVTVFMLILVNR